MIILKFFDMDGKEVRQEDWAEALVLGAVKATIEQYRQRALTNVSQLVCAIHGSKAALVFNVMGDPQ